MLIYIVENTYQTTDRIAFTNKQAATKYSVKNNNINKPFNQTTVNEIELVVDEFIDQVFNLTNQKDTL